MAPRPSALLDVDAAVRIGRSLGISVERSMRAQIRYGDPLFVFVPAAVCKTCFTENARADYAQGS